MNLGRWFALAIVTSLVGAIVWGIRGTSLSTDSADQAAQSRPTAPQPAVEAPDNVASDSDFVSSPAPTAGEARAKAKRDRPSIEPGSRLAIIRDAESAPSAVERANELERLADTEPVLAARKLLELAEFCSPRHLDAQERFDAPPGLLKQRRNWCAGLKLSTEVMKTRLEELMQIDEDLEGEAAQVERLARHPYLGRQYEMEEELANATELNRSDRFTKWVRQARDFDEINNLLTLNMLHAQENGGRPLWRLGAEIQSRLYPQAELLQAQKVAIILFGCQRFGGCESGQYMTMVACTIGIFGQCGTGSSLFEHLYLTTTPVNYSLAGHILARI